MGNLLIANLQHESKAWRNKNFGPTLSDELGNLQSIEQLMGMIEELGELSHVILKSRQGIRGGLDPITAQEEEADALGDLFIFMLGYAHRRNLDLEYIILKTWEKVERRDWIADPERGGE
jgi:NTP pyrophosphatase (non-canonical NTP hydrolase)